MVTIEETKPVTDSLANTEAPVADNAGAPSATPKIASNSIATSSAEEATTPVVENNATPQSSEESTTTEDNTLTILHTNDMHGRIVEESSVIGTPKLAEIAEENRQQGTTLVLDSRDAFQGLPISNSTKGEDMATIMNAVGYDAMTLGNHEFDFGLDQLKKLHDSVNFPIISSNVYVKGVRLFDASTIIDKNKAVDGDKVVVIGVTTPETATKTHPRNVVDVTFTDPITEVNTVISQVEANARAEGKTYNRYIILAHLGVDTTTPEEWRGDSLAKALATNIELAGKQVLVLDGHSHTALVEQFGNVTYNQTGSYLNNVGKITLNSEKILSNALIDAKTGKAVKEDEMVATLVNAIKDKYATQNAVVVLDNNPVELNGQRENVRVRETNLGNLVADALLDYSQTGFSHKSNLAVTNGGGLRETIKKDQPITKGDLIAVLPFGNVISQITVTGQQLQEMFTKSVGSILQNVDGKAVLDENGLPLLEPSGGFLQIAGAKVYYDPTLPAENRVRGIQILDPESNTYKALDWKGTYYLTTNDFLAAGGDGYTMLGGTREEGPSMDAVFADYLPKADLTSYAVINPNTRSVAISTANYKAMSTTQVTPTPDTPAPVVPAPLVSAPISPVPQVAPTPASSTSQDTSVSQGQEASSNKTTSTKVVNTPSLQITYDATSQQMVVTQTKSSSEVVPVSYQTAKTNKILPKTADEESVVSLLVGFGLLAAGLYGVRRKGYRN